MKPYRFVFAVVCGLALFVVAGGVQAQEKYPSRSIELVVVVAPGGSGDLSCRSYSEELARVLKVPVTVVNRPGGSGVQGTAYVVRAKKDGYTILHDNESPTITLPIISKEATYDTLKDLIPLGHFASIHNVIAVRSDSPFKTLEELVEYARKNPGKLRSSSGGLWNASHVDLEIFCANANIKIVTIPFASSGEALPNLLGGHLDLMSSTTSTVGPHIKAGKLRGLAYTTKTRDPNYPDIPTLTELGYTHESYAGWFGVFAPAGVPQEVLNVLIPAVEKTFKNPEVVQRAAKVGVTARYMGPEEFRKYMESQRAIMEKIARDNNLIKK